MIDLSVPQSSKTLLDAEVGLLPILEAVINVPPAAILVETIRLVSIICPKNHQQDCRVYAVEVNYSVSMSLQAEMHSRLKNLTGCPPMTETKALPLKSILACTSTTTVRSLLSIGCYTIATGSWLPFNKLSYLISRSYSLLVKVWMNKNGSRADYIPLSQVPLSVSFPQLSHTSRIPGYDERITLAGGRVVAYDEELRAYESLWSQSLSMVGPGLWTGPMWSSSRKVESVSILFRFEGGGLPQKDRLVFRIEGSTVLGRGFRLLLKIEIVWSKTMHNLVFAR